jgi:hypothetical protein
VQKLLASYSEYSKKPVTLDTASAAFERRASEINMRASNRRGDRTMVADGRRQRKKIIYIEQTLPVTMTYIAKANDAQRLAVITGTI